jgi:Flp pilus assembly protein TadD
MRRGCGSVRSLRGALVIALLCSAAACAWGPKPASEPAAVGVAPPPVTAAIKAAEPESAVSAAVRRAYEDALRALRVGRNDEAERALIVLTRSAPDLGGPYANLGLLYARTGKPLQAVAALEQAVQLSPRQPIYFNALGIAYRQHGQFAKARDAYEKAIELDATYAAPLLNLGILHDLYLSDGPRALELYGRYLALAVNPDATVTKWVADLKNRNGKQQQVGLLGPKEMQ